MLVVFPCACYIYVHLIFFLSVVCCSAGVQHIVGCGNDCSPGMSNGFFIYCVPETLYS